MCVPQSRLGEAKRAKGPGVVYLYGHVSLLFDLRLISRLQQHIVWVDEQGTGWEHQVYGDT